MLADPPALLFVDDEKNILKSLLRLFIDEDLELFSALGGGEALRIIDEEHIDIVISDIRMPEMSGVTFLNFVRERHPQIIRLALTGYAEKETIINMLSDGTAQQIISKPWNDEQLISTVDWVLQQAIDQEMNEIGLEKFISNMTALPPLPETYTAFQECLADADGPDMDKIAQIIQQDIALTSALLHWSNSALFGQMRKVDTITRALVVLGLEMSSGLILSTVLSQKLCKESKIKDFNIDSFQKHSLGCGVIARHLVREIKNSTNEEADKAFTAGMLHDLGKLAELSVMPDTFKNILAHAHQEKSSFIEQEQEIIKTSHAELGAYLANWWNLPDYLVEAIKLHHKPILCSHNCTISQAVYAANILIQQFGIGSSGNGSWPELNPTVASRFDLTEDRIATLREKVKDMI